MTNNFILKIAKNILFLSPKLSFTLAQTNLAEKLSFSDRAEVYFLVHPIKLDNCNLDLTIIEYNLANTTSFELQEFHEKIDTLNFQILDWNKLEPFLSYYSKINLTSIFTNLPFHKTELQYKKGIEAFKKNDPAHSKVENKSSTKVSFEAKFDAIAFYDGYATITHHLPGFKDPIEVKIENINLKSEFNYIKDFFAKKLKVKIFEITATITFNDFGISAIGSCNEIDRINNDLIESVKIHETLQLPKQMSNEESGKYLYELNDLLKLLNKNSVDSNIFNKNDQDVISELLNSKDIRNKKQLLFLSEQQSQKEKIRYTLNPLFGFLFYIEGQRNNHYCWELLDSHATYIWSIKKNKFNNLLEIEKQISFIRKNGRKSYRSNFKTMLEDNNLAFNIIYHTNENESKEANFNNWKQIFNNIRE